MTKSPDQHTHLEWLYVLPLLVTVAVAIVLWKPAPDPPPSAEQEAKIADLAARLGSKESSAGDLDDRLRSFGPFVPDATASRALAESLIRCETITLDESQRTRLARHLYGITVIGDDAGQAIPAALMGIQQVMAVARPACGPGLVDRVVTAARAVAATDPNPRRNWW
jgi:hypothetical protein